MDEGRVRKILPVEDEKWHKPLAMKKKTLKLHVDFCKIFSNPRRLKILCLLRSGKLTIGGIA